MVTSLRELTSNTRPFTSVFYPGGNVESIVDPLTGSNVDGVIPDITSQDSLFNFGGANLALNIESQIETTSSIASSFGDVFEYYVAASALAVSVNDVVIASGALAALIEEDLAEEDSEEDSEVELIEEELISENDSLKSNNLIQNSLMNRFIPEPTSIAESNIIQEYNANYGYGLVDATVALSSATGGTAFPDVQDLGENFWGVDAVNAPEVWAQGYTGENITVAVIDTGVDYTHGDLDENIWLNDGEIQGNGIDDDGNGYVDDLYGWNFVDGNNDPQDVHGHGTHVAGTIAAENNSSGVTGVAHDAQIMSVRAFDENGAGTNTDIAAGIIYAVDNGADIINLSFGGGYSPSIEAAGQYAIEQGVAVVMSSGNNSASSPLYPARYAEDWGIAVGAIDKNGQMANFSNNAGFAPLDYVVAPGVDIFSTFPDDRYAYTSGTSMAAPHVSGVAALVLSANPELASAEIESLLTETADPTDVLV